MARLSAHRSEVLRVSSYRLPSPGAWKAFPDDLGFRITHAWMEDGTILRKVTSYRKPFSWESRGKGKRYVQDDTGWKVYRRGAFLASVSALETMRTKYESKGWIVEICQ